MAYRFNLSSSFVKMHKNVHTFLNPEVKMIVVSISNLGILLIDYVILNWSSNIRCGGRLKSACCFNLFSFIILDIKRIFPICLWIHTVHEEKQKFLFSSFFMSRHNFAHSKYRRMHTPSAKYVKKGRKWNAGCHALLQFLNACSP